MELRDIVKLFKKNLSVLLATTIIFGIIGVFLYFLIPVKYLSTGTLYVKRSVENGQGQFFTYEGYYNQQTAIAYANTVLGLLESTDIKSQALNDMNQQATESTIRKLSRQMKVKKAANQLINLTVKTNSAQQSEDLWLALTKNTIETAQIQNNDSDPSLQIATLTERPVVKEVYRNVWLNLLIGSGVGLALSLLYLSLKSYFKEIK